MKKRVLSLALAVCMLVSLLPVGMLASAAGETLNVVYSYEFKDLGISYYNAEGANIRADGLVDIKNNDEMTYEITGEFGDEWKQTNRNNAYFRSDGEQTIVNGAANSTGWILVTFNVEEAGSYVPQIVYEGYAAEDGKLASAANFYLTTAKDGTMDAEDMILSIPRETEAGSYSVACDEAIALDAGDYRLWIEQDGTEGVDVEDAIYRCVALDSFQLCKVAITDIEITGASESMLVGEVANLTTVATPATADPTATWISTNPSVATVENGVVTAVAAGTADIIAMSDDNASVTDRVTIKVLGETYNYNFKAVAQSLFSGSRVDLKDANTMNYENAAAAGSAPWKHYTRGAYCSYNGTDLYMNGAKGGTSYMVYTIKVEKGGVYSAAMFYDTWTSSAPMNIYISKDTSYTNINQEGAADALLVSIAGSNTDADGLVAKSSKNVTLDAGEYFLSFVQYADEENDRYVILKNLNLYKVASLPISGVEISCDVADIMGIGDFATLTANILPASAADDQEIVWASSNEDVITVDNGMIEAVGMGTATITATVEGKSDSIVLTVGEFAKYEIQDFANANGAAALLSATAETTDGYGNWDYFYFDGTPSINASSFTWKDVVLVGKYYAIKVNVAKTGVYAAQVISDTVGSSADADLYISKLPAGGVNTNAERIEYAANSLVEANKFVNVPWGGNGEDVENMVSTSAATKILEAGEYVLWIKKEASYADKTFVNPETGATESGYKDRYFMIDAINLICVSELATINGAAVRVNDPMGIRFLSSIPKSLAEDAVEYGTILLPTEMLGADELTCDVANVAIVPAANLYKVTDDAYHFTAVLYNMPYSAYKTEITARAYAKLADGSYVYGNTVARSIYQVAELGLANPNASAKEKATFEAIIANAQ